jgi:uncharacterized RDD family membrane protein YckC
MIEHKYSTFWPRFCAGFVDGLLFMPLGLACSFAMSHYTSVPLRIVAYIVNSSAYLIYSIWTHGKFGQTLGKMACKVVVLDSSEKSLSMRQAFLRDIVGVVLVPVGLAKDIPRIIRGIDISLPENMTTVDLVIGYSAFVWFLIEIITMLTNNKRRALHDFIAGSVVTRVTNKSSEPAMAMPVP